MHAALRWQAMRALRVRPVRPGPDILLTGRPSFGSCEIGSEFDGRMPLFGRPVKAVPLDFEPWFMEPQVMWAQEPCHPAALTSGSNMRSLICRSAGSSSWKLSASELFMAKDSPGSYQDTGQRARAPPLYTTRISIPNLLHIQLHSTSQFRASSPLELRSSTPLRSSSWTQSLEIKSRI